MKKTAFSLVLLLGLVAASCSSSDGAKTATTAAGSANAPAATSLNIRYINEDSILKNYNLAKDVQEATLRAYSKLSSAEQTKGAEIQRFGQQIQEKMQSNGYLSQASYDADVAKLNKMQQDAQNYLASLQRSTEQELATQQQQLADSIESYIKAYNADKGYDAILRKASGFYFNPSLDITNEIVEGLNARYNKVSESK